MRVKRSVVVAFILTGLAAATFLVFIVAAAAPIPGAPPSGTPLLLPGGSTIAGALTTDDTWGPGTITVTGDIMINPGVTIVITPGTTVQMATTDGANLGLDPTRVEYLVGGTLQVNGAVTFTSQSGTPACGDWVGIYFVPGSSGYLDHATVEYGVHAVEIATTNRITVANSTLRHNCHRLSTGHTWGAGMALYAGTHLVTNTAIYDNRVELIASTPGTWAEGGGVHMVFPAGPTVFENCVLHDNHALNQGPVSKAGGDAGAGAINVLQADPILRHCEIYSNTSSGDQRAFGGGLYLGDSNAVIEGDTFVHDNAAWGGTMAYGGGICLSEAGMPAPTRPIIRDSRVVSNTVSAWPYPSGGHGKMLGGGIAFYDGSRTRAVISNTLIAGNGAGEYFGQVCGGGIGMATGASADRFDRNLIRDNSVACGPHPGTMALGGGICLSSTNAVSVTNNLVFNNKVNSPNMPYGGGIYANGPQSYLVNNTVVSNTVHGIPWHFMCSGGGVYLAAGVLSNTLVVGNSAPGDGGGVYWAGGSAGYNDVWGNSCIMVGCGADYAATGNPRPATDIYADPHFAGSGDVAAQYHLLPGSPAIDKGIGTGTGVPREDYDGQPRPEGVTWEIGFDEVEVHHLYLPLVLKNHP